VGRIRAAHEGVDANPPVDGQTACTARKFRAAAALSEEREPARRRRSMPPVADPPPGGDRTEHLFPELENVDGGVWGRMLRGSSRQAGGRAEHHPTCH